MTIGEFKNKYPVRLKAHLQKVFGNEISNVNKQELLLQAFYYNSSFSGIYYNLAAEMSEEIINKMPDE